MKAAFLTLVLSFAFLTTNLWAQQKKSGLILGLDNESVIIDLGSKDTKTGDFFKVVKSGKYFVHPQSKDTIRMNDELVANLKIMSVYDNYAVAECIPAGALSKLEQGMNVSKVTEAEYSIQGQTKSVAVVNINLMGAFSPFVGLYLADMLVASLHGKGDLKIIDRSTLGFQDYEKSLSQNVKIDDNEFITSGRSRGVDYLIVGSVECDVNEKSTNIPIKGIMSAAEAISGTNLGADFVSDVKMKKLVAIATIYLRVIDVRTGEIVFISSEMVRREGESNVNLEQGALGGLQLNGGATDFVQTVSGQAAKQGLNASAQYIIDYFSGKIKQKSYTGNVVSKNKRDLVISSGNFRVGDTVFYYSGQAPSPMQRSKIVISYPNSSEAQIQILEGNKANSVLKVDHTELLGADLSKNYCLVNSLSTLKIGQKVIIYNGDYFSEGTVVSRPGSVWIDISYETRTKNGESKVQTSMFNSTRILVPRYDEESGCNDCNCYTGQPEERISQRDSLLQEITALLSGEEFSELVEKDDGSKIAISLRMQRDGSFGYLFSEEDKLDPESGGLVTANGDYKIKLEEIPNEGYIGIKLQIPDEVVVSFFGFTSLNTSFTLKGKLKKYDTNYIFTYIDYSDSSKEELSLSNFRLPTYIIRKEKQ